MKVDTHFCEIFQQKQTAATIAAEQPHTALKESNSRTHRISQKAEKRTDSSTDRTINEDVDDYDDDDDDTALCGTHKHIAVSERFNWFDSKHTPHTHA